MGAHSGRCFRAWRRTKARKAKQGLPWDFPIRQKVPALLRLFLTGPGRHAGRDAMTLAISRFGKQVEAMKAMRRGTARGQ